MKSNIYFLLIYLMFDSNYLFSQSYVPFPSDNAIWRIEDIDYIATPCYSHRTYYIHMIGDTVINNIQYKKLYEKTTHLTCTYVNYGRSYFGAIRQDTLLKKVFYHNFLNGTESVLYDFDLQLSDTLPNGIINQETTPQIIDVIDSIQLLDGSYRKTYHVSPGRWCGSNLLIEGIGSSWGLLTAMYCGIGVFTNTSCFFVDSTLLLEIFPTSNMCLLPTSNELNPFYEFDTNIFPNPCNEYVEITSSKNIIKVNLYSNFKTLLFSFDATKNKKLKIDLSKLSVGVFFCEIVYENYKSYHKIIKL